MTGETGLGLAASEHVHGLFAVILLEGWRRHGFDLKIFHHNLEIRSKPMEDFDFIILEGLDLSLLSELELDPNGYDVDVSPSWQIDDIAIYFSAPAAEPDSLAITQDGYSAICGLIVDEA